MRVRSSFWHATAVAAFVLVQSTAPAGAQVAGSVGGHRWMTDIEAAPLRHTGGAVGEDQAGANLAGTGGTGSAGIGWLTQSGAGIRFSLRGYGLQDASHDPGWVLATGGCSDFGMCLVATRDEIPTGAFVAIGPSIDLASGIASEGLPLGVEVGPDAFRTLQRPRARQLNPVSQATIMGVHVTGVLAPVRRANWRITGGAQWLAGNIVEWMFPFGVRYSF